MINTPDDLLNRCLVGTQQDYIVIQLPMKYMTKTEALVHAAWIVAIADIDNEFPVILDAVRNS